MTHQDTAAAAAVLVILAGVGIAWFDLAALDATRRGKRWPRVMWITGAILLYAASAALLLTTHP